MDTDQDTEHNLPTGPGLYLAKTNDTLVEWNVLVLIYGTAPFLQWKAWEYEKEIVRLDRYEINWFYFGPQIGRYTEAQGIVPIQTAAKE